MEDGDEAAFLADALASPTTTTASAQQRQVDAAVRQAVHAAVRQPLEHVVPPPQGDGAQQTAEGAAAEPSHAESAPVINPFSVYKTYIADRNGMPVQLPPGAPQTLLDLLLLGGPVRGAPQAEGPHRAHLTVVPSTPFQQRVQRFFQRHHFHFLSPVQQAAAAFAAEGRDLLLVAPPATGKTFAYAFPVLLQLLMAQQGERQLPPPREDDAAAQEEGGGGLPRQAIENLLRQQIASGEVCRYCELHTRDVRVCPLTGIPHAALDASALDAATPQQRWRAAATRLEELGYEVAQPQVLVLVPTAQLAAQVFAVFQQLNPLLVADGDQPSLPQLRIKYLVRARSAEEQRQHLRALQDGVDVLISTPETLLPAYYKKKLALRRVRTVVLDEVDELCSTNHFEPLKILLGALPKDRAAGGGAPAVVQRPQRICVSASLPPVVYEMLRARLLEAAHRFVLCDTRLDHLGRIPSYPLPQPQVTTAAAAAAAPLRVGLGGPVVLPELRYTTLLVGRIEKMAKLVSLFADGSLRIQAGERVLIFCNSRQNVAYVKEQLERRLPPLVFALDDGSSGRGATMNNRAQRLQQEAQRVRVLTLTSHASATAQDGVLKLFAKGITNILICTDLLARGIDFQGVTAVVHYDMAPDMDTYAHRCGRCGRNLFVRRPPADRAGDEAWAAEQQVPRGYIFTFFQPENVRLAKPLVAYLAQRHQVIPPKLREYAKHAFVDIAFKNTGANSLFHSPTRPYRAGDPQNSTSVVGRGAPRFPDYRQGSIQKHFRPY
ncbi:ATP-dependent RNA helicase RhlE [Strigomonas culicis]|uniref:ATP-dependent RNA helicase RhlE n=1 Tax=Strigomonas culicis TaxID=28005 RepID=S9TZY9_9TRYP|nr:ATP-dependent RNA helicase RhlE [Strigomonas culicis]|eukprot:EPY22159.1 ATP-dependent RNA helicase RhlE [Strigomonas culicis]